MKGVAIRPELLFCAAEFPTLLLRSCNVLVRVEMVSLSSIHLVSASRTRFSVITSVYKRVASSTPFQAMAGLDQLVAQGGGSVSSPSERTPTSRFDCQNRSATTSEAARGSGLEGVGWRVSLISYLGR